VTLERRYLGSTGIEVSVIGLGTVKLGRRSGLKVAPFRVPTFRKAQKLIHRARDLGINLIDTAPAYGESEALLGMLLKGEREHWVISTKAGERHVDGVSLFDFSPESIRESVDESLVRLATDYLDIVFVHSDGRDKKILENRGTMDQLKELKNAGKIRATGFSYKTLDGGESALDSCDVIMATLSKSNCHESTLVREAGVRGRGVLIKKALDSGTAAPESLRHVADQPGVSSILVGTIDPFHLEADVTALSLDPI
jgi:aryl-alcohol dehydrogenase-like predicted oxidoreductase